MASFTLGQCCCDCPPKEDAGLPDSLVAAFTVLESSDTGMPADESLGTCGGGDWYYRFSYSPAVVELLSSIVYDYVAAAGSGCGGHTCCYLYTGRTDFEVTCPTTFDTIYIGESPFEAYSIADTVLEEFWTGNSTNGGYARAAQPYFYSHSDTLPTEPCNTAWDIDGNGSPNVVPWCCSAGWHWAADFETCEPAGDSSVNYVCTDQSSEGCHSTCGDVVTWFGGTVYLPAFIHASSTLMICVEGNVVTICITISLTNHCVTKTGGDGSEWGPHETGCDTFGGSCQREEDWTDIYGGVNPSPSVGCDGANSAIYLTATADLTAVTGATIWDKIKAYDWESAFESSLCNCGGGGCVTSYEHIEYECEITIGCGCLATTDAVHISEADYPRDIDCFYAVGTLAIGLSDE